MCNLNTFSQLLRILIGLMLIATAWFGPKTLMLDVEYLDFWTLGWTGLIPLFSGIAAFCPVYAVLGHNNKNNRKQ